MFCRCALCALVLVAGCDPEPPTLSCEEQACAHVAACSPVITGGVDWRTTEACLASDWTCAEPERCLAAVEALPCLSTPPTWEEIEASTFALVAVRQACLGAPR